MPIELNTLAPKKWVGNYSGVIPTLDSSDGIYNGDLAIDSSVSPNKIWSCEDNTEGAPIWIGANEMIKNTYSTGMIEGGILSINGVDNTKFDISAGTGYVSDNFTDPTNPVVIFVKWDAFSSQTPAYLATNTTSEIFIDSSGSVVQFSATPTPDQFRDYVYLGRLVHNNLTNIAYVINLQRYIFNVALSVSDIAGALGSINVSGNLYSANGANLNLNKSSGETYRYGINYVTSRKNPSRLTDNPQTDLTLRYRYRDGSTGFTTDANRTTVVPGLYDNGSGTPQAVGANQWTIQRIYYFTGQETTYITYGQTLYSKLADAVAGVETENPVIDITLSTEASLRCYLIVKGNTTALNNTAENSFRTGGKLGEALGGGSSGGDVVGPATATANSIARFDGTTGKLIKDGANATLDDSGNATFAGTVIGRSAITTKTTTYTVTANDSVILADATSASFTITLPAAATNTGLHIYIKKIDSTVNTVTIDANASELIDGELTQIIGDQYNCMEAVCDGTAWYIV